MRNFQKYHHSTVKGAMLSFLTAAMLMTHALGSPVAVCAVDEAVSPIAVAETAGTVSYAGWKQYAPAWASLPIGQLGDTMKSSGCAVTSAAILCAASGCTLPEGFDPGMLCRFLTDNGGFSKEGLLQWYVISRMVPAFTYVTTETLGTKVQREQISKLAAYINEGYYVSVMIQYPDSVADGKTVPGTTHFVAIDRIENGIVYMFDPATYHDSLYAAYDAATIQSVRLFRGAESPEPITPEDSDAVDYADGVYDTIDNLNLRSTPALDGVIYKVIPNGTRIEITETAGEWGKCIWDGTEGWVCLRYCTPAIALYTAGTYCTDGNSLTMRSAPSASADAVGYLSPQTTVTVTEVSGGWGYCSANGKTGWISLRYCSSQDDGAETAISVQYTTGENCMRLRAAATTQSDTLALLGTETVFTVTQIDGSWGKTVYQGLEGWVHLGYCTMTDSENATEPDEESAQLYTTGANCVRLRAEASADSETLAFIGTDMVLSVTEISGSWGKTVYQDKIGWVHLGYCTLCTSEEAPDEETPAALWPAGEGACVVVASGLNVRQSGAVTGQWIGRLGRGDTVTVLACEGDWARIQWQDGTGWVCLGEYGTPYLYRCGDVTLDGVCDASDQTLMTAFFSGVALFDDVQRLTADMNGDGIVNAADLALMESEGA